MDLILGGIEGGATKSNIVLVNGKGEKLAHCSGPSTNHWMIGIPECQQRIFDLTNVAKKEAKIPLDRSLDCLGMCLSGCEQEQTNNEIVKGLQNRFPTLSKHYLIASDTVGPVATVHERGGAVLIAGTGSNSLLINPNNSIIGCGGMGHILGDEGSAYWISHKAIKICIDNQNNYAMAPQKTDFVWKSIQEHFHIKNVHEILDHCYTNFDKKKFSGLCKLLAEGAKRKDPLCLLLFTEAGSKLAQHLRALIPRADPSLISESGGLRVVCVGSVWCSWDFLKSGFIECLEKPTSSKNSIIDELSLIRLTVSAAIGAIYLAAKSINLNLPKDYKKNYEVFFNYVRKK